jgi:predicted permease
MLLRLVRRSPLFSVSVVVLLGVGIGASTLIFTAIDAFLLRPLQVPQAERLARLGVEASASHVTFEQSGIFANILAGRGRSFETVFSFYPLDAAFAAGRHVETVTCEVVSDNYFAALGLRPQRGAFFTGAPGDSLPAVVSGALWRRAFRYPEDAAGSGIRLRGAAFTVVGVMKDGFGGLDLERRADIWVPVSAWKAWSANPDLDPRREPAQVFVRLREGVTLAQAEAEVRVLYPAMVEADLAGVKGITPSDVAREKRRRVVLAGAAQGVSALRKQFSTAAGALVGAIATLLVLIAANAGGLMLARGEARRGEIALRMSLGASRWDVVRETLAESALLASAGAAMGWPAARWCGPALIAFLPSRRPLNVGLNPDVRVLAFTIAATAGVAVLASVAPALRAMRTDLMQVLGKSGSRVTAPVSGRVIVAVQVALATLLAAASVSLVRSLHALRQQDPGFARERLIVAVLEPEVAGVKGAEVPRIGEEILRRARELPGAAGASLSGRPLMRGLGMKTTLGPAGSRLTPAGRLNVSVNYASETHFANMGMALVAGRTVTPLDANTRPVPVVVTASLARKFFPGLDPLGRELGRAGPDGVALAAFRIAGVVRDVKYRGMREVAPPTVFTPSNNNEEMVTLHVRTRIDEAAMMREIRAMLASIGPGLVPVEMATMEQDIDTSLWQERMLSALSQAFAALAALIAAAGLFGTMAFTLARRTHETGIRVAIGATRASIAGLYARYAGTAVAPGILLGWGVFAVARRALDPLLFGAGADTLVPLAASTALLAAASLAAVAVPVIRATRIEPAAALREE